MYHIKENEDKYSFIGAMSGVYPYATHYLFDDVDKVNIIGEIYEVITHSYLQYLDKFEYNYNREIVSVIVDGKKLKCLQDYLTTCYLYCQLKKHLVVHLVKKVQWDVQSLFRDCYSSLK